MFFLNNIENIRKFDAPLFKNSASIKPRVSLEAIITFLERDFSKFHGNQFSINKLRETLRSVNSEYYDQYDDYPTEFRILDILSHSWDVRIYHYRTGILDEGVHDKNRLSCSVCGFKKYIDGSEKSVSLNLLLKLVNEFDADHREIVSCNEEIVGHILSE